MISSKRPLLTWMTVCSFWPYLSLVAGGKYLIASDFKSQKCQGLIRSDGKFPCLSQLSLIALQ